MNMNWVKAALIRAVKTFFQALLSVIAIDQTAGIGDINWIHALSVAALAAVISIATSMAGLPEVSSGE